jgi:hypothetical protein
VPTASARLRPVRGRDVGGDAPGRSGLDGVVARAADVDPDLDPDLDPDVDPDLDPRLRDDLAGPDPLPAEDAVDDRLDGMEGSSTDQAIIR